MMLKNTMYYTKANVSSGGGNDLVRYFAFLGYAGEDDIYKIGPAANYNRVNINANLDIKLHRYIRRASAWFRPWASASRPTTVTARTTRARTPRRTPRSA